jgi:hypothetical protein
MILCRDWNRAQWPPDLRTVQLPDGEYHGGDDVPPEGHREEGLQ